MDKALALVGHGLDFLNSNKGAIGTTLGILFAIAKAVSTEKAPAGVAVIQKTFDAAAQGLTKLGQLAQSVSDLLASVLQSDGVFGKK